MKKNVILIGAGGYSKSVLDSLNTAEYQMFAFIDERKDLKEHLGFPVIGNDFCDINNKNDYVYFVSIGNNERRKIWFDKLIENKLEIINVIDETAIISKKAEIGIGCFVGKMAIINSCSSIGDNTIINTKSLIEHGCTVGDHVNISTGSIINGDVIVGNGSTLYSGTVVIGQKRVGSWTITGAGTIVTKDLPDNVLAVGVPAKIVKRNIYG